MGRAALRFAFACASTSPGLCGSSSEHPTPPRPLYALLSASRSGAGLCRLGCVSGLLRGFYGRDPRGQCDDNAPVLPVTLGCVLQLLSEVGNLLTKILDALRQVG